LKGRALAVVQGAIARRGRRGRPSCGHAALFAGTAPATPVAVLDLLFVVVTIVFFIVSVAYANACDRL
jgi:hypothetical protein